MITMYDYLGEHPIIGTASGISGVLLGFIDPVMIAQIPIWLDLVETGIHIALMIITGAVAVTTLVSWMDKNGYIKLKRKK